MSAAASRKVKVGAVKVPSDTTVDKALPRNMKSTNNAASGWVCLLPSYYLCKRCKIFNINCCNSHCHQMVNEYYTLLGARRWTHLGGYRTECLPCPSSFFSHCLQGYILCYVIRQSLCWAIAVMAEVTVGDAATPSLALCLLIA